MNDRDITVLVGMIWFIVLILIHNLVYSHFVKKYSWFESFKLLIIYIICPFLIIFVSISCIRLIVILIMDIQ